MEPDSPDGDTEPDDGGDNEPDGGDDGGNDATSPVSLSHMTKAELLDYAEAQGITGLDGLTKAQIIEEVQANV